MVADTSLDLNAVDGSGWTALMYAANFYHPDDKVFELLLQANADPNRASLAGDTALMIAAQNGRLNRTLLEHGADINAWNGRGVTLLMYLSQHANPGDIAAALKAGADAGARDAEGRTAVEYLKRAACGKAIVALPVVESSVLVLPPGCESKAVLESEALLTAAMRKGIAAR